MRYPTWGAANDEHPVSTAAVAKEVRFEVGDFGRAEGASGHARDMQISSSSILAPASVAEFG
jgi:hypothetical protein